MCVDARAMACMWKPENNFGSQFSPFTFAWVPQLHSGGKAYPSTAWPDEPSHLPYDALVYETQSKQLFDAV